MYPIFLIEGSIEEMSCTPTHSYQICLSVINTKCTTEMHEGCPFSSPLKNIVYRIKHNYVVDMASKLVMCNT